MSEKTDEELMGRYAAGDKLAFDELFNRYEGRAFAYFTRRTGSEDRASDLYQELFLRIHRFRDRYDPSRPFSPWFYRVAHNVLVDDFRSLARSSEIPLDVETIPSPRPDAEHEIDCRQRSRALLRILPSEQAAVLIAAKALGMDYASIALQFGKSVDAVKQGASRSVRRLRAVQEGSP